MFLPGVGPYALEPDEKRAYLGRELLGLLEHHASRCEPYSRYVQDWRRHAGDGEPSVEAYPFLPVTVFKEFDLRSTDEAVMSVRSSSTTSDKAARIFVDKATRKRQNLSANKVLADFIGTEQRPYLVFDLERTVRGAESLSARGAAILSLAHLSSGFHFVVREEADGALRVDLEALEKALATIGDRPFMAYGFTWILFQAHQELARAGRAFRAHPGSVLLHSGGWKRLEAMAVDKPTFNREVSAVWGLSPSRVIDFYGAVEQVGVPYPDCPAGHKHVPYWAEVITRRPDTLEPASVAEPGLLQLVSALPLSAPNHSVLTEDVGEIVMRDGCPCGRRGTAFVFRGRAPKAELRGCSDVGRR